MAARQVGPIPEDAFIEIVVQILSEELSSPLAEVQVGSKSQAQQLASSLARRLALYPTNPNQE